jgi:ATP-binding cassette subfamily B protein
MFKLSRFLKNYKKEVLLGPAFKLVEAVFELIVPLVMAEIIDTGVKNKDISYVLLMGGIMLLLGVVGLCSTLVCQRYASVASQGFGTDVRNELFKHIMKFSNNEIDRLGTSSLITRLTNDINQMQIAVAMLIRLVVRAPFLVMGSIIMAMLLDLKLSLVFIAVTPLLALAVYLIMSRSIPYFRVIQRKLDKISVITRENLSGARVIRAFSKKESEEDRFSEANNDLIRTYINVGKISTLLNPVTYLIMNTGIIAVIWFGGLRVDNGVLTQGQIIAFVNYMSQILLALIVVANLVIIFTKASASAARINEVFETNTSITDNSRILNDIDNKKPDMKIQYKNVNFSYNRESGEKALTNINLDIKKGETVGIIGGTGAGKSTLVNLLLRLYETDSGEILIDGINIKNYP